MSYAPRGRHEPGETLHATRDPGGGGGGGWDLVGYRDWAYGTHVNIGKKNDITGNERGSVLLRRGREEL